MRTKTFLSLAALLALASATLAADDIHTKMVIALEDDGDGDPIRMELDSDLMGFDLHELQVGENRAFVDAAGRNVFVTREADGFTFEVDGETIRMPAFGPGHDSGHWIADVDVDDVDVQVLYGADATVEFRTEDVMIISDQPIDAETQQAIRSLLESAGQEGDVRFIDGTAPHGAPHRIKVIHKKVELAD